MWCVRVTWNFLMNIDIYMDFILIVLALLIRNGNPVSLLEMEIETIAPGRRGFLRSPHPFFRNSVVSFICPFMFTYFFFLCSLVSSWFGLVWFSLLAHNWKFNWFTKWSLLVGTTDTFYLFSFAVLRASSSFFGPLLLASKRNGWQFFTVLFRLRSWRGFLQFGAKITLRPARIVVADVFAAFRFGCAESVCLWLERPKIVLGPAAKWFSAKAKKGLQCVSCVSVGLQIDIVMSSASNGKFLARAQENLSLAWPCKAK